LTKDKQNQILAAAAKNMIQPDIIEESLANALRNKFNNNNTFINFILFKSPIHDNTGINDNKILAQEANEYLSESERIVVLANTIRNHLDLEHVKKILQAASPNSSIEDENIERILSAATAQALEDIIKRDYHGIVKPNAKEIIDIGIAVYGNGNKVKTAFGSVLRFPD
jgi:hypothetical protein